MLANDSELVSTTLPGKMAIDPLTGFPFRVTLPWADSIPALAASEAIPEIGQTAIMIHAKTFRI
jgi:hypothetical protein